MTPTYSWFRWYHEAIHDRKLRCRPASDRWLWVVLCTMASSSPDRGHLLIAIGEPASIEVIADEAALSLEDTKTGLEYFERIGSLSRDEDGAYALPKFMARQYVSDNSTARTRAYRDKGAAQPNETFPKRSRRRSRNVPVTDQIQITDTELTPPIPPKGGYSEDFELLWKRWQPTAVRTDNKSRAWHAYHARLGEGIKHEALVTACGHYAKYCRDKGAIRKHLSTFLGPDRHFEDFMEPVAAEPMPKPPVDTEKPW